MVGFAVVGVDGIRMVCPTLTKLDLRSLNSIISFEELSPYFWAIDPRVSPLLIL